MRANSCRIILATAAVTLGVVFSIRAGDATAFSLIKEGNRYVADDVKDKVVQIHSEKSIGGLTPNIWYIDYDDEDATFKIAEVKFEGGQKVSVKRPMRPLELTAANKVIMDKRKMNIDSDKAQSIATGDSSVASAKIKATQLWLQTRNDGVIWKVRLWAEKPDHPGDTADIGDIYISADDGKVTERDVHLERLR
jgi:hypothetical protein